MVTYGNDKYVAIGGCGKTLISYDGSNVGDIKFYEYFIEPNENLYVSCITRNKIEFKKGVI